MVVFPHYNLNISSYQNDIPFHCIQLMLFICHLSVNPSYAFTNTFQNKSLGEENIIILEDQTNKNNLIFQNLVTLLPNYKTAACWRRHKGKEEDVKGLMKRGEMEDWWSEGSGLQWLVSVGWMVIALVCSHDNRYCSAMPVTRPPALLTVRYPEQSNRDVALRFVPAESHQYKNPAKQVFNLNVNNVGIHSVSFLEWNVTKCERWFMCQRAAVPPHARHVSDKGGVTWVTAPPPSEVSDHHGFLSPCFPITSPNNLQHQQRRSLHMCAH